MVVFPIVKIDFRFGLKNSFTKMQFAGLKKRDYEIFL